MLEIRPYRAEDRAAVRAVCMDTALLGNSIRPYYPDEDSLADALTGYFTDQEPESAWVIVREARVLGYLLGCVDSRKAPMPEWVMAKQVLTRFLWLRPGTAATAWRSAFSLVRDFGHARPKVDYERWPAHCHIDLLPEARKGAIALRLFRLWQKTAEERGACGMWGVSFLENEPATVFHRALGFRTFGEPFRMRDPSGGLLRGQVWVRELAMKAAADPLSP